MVEIMSRCNQQSDWVLEMDALSAQEAERLLKWGALQSMWFKASHHTLETGLSPWKIKQKILKRYDIHSPTEALLYLDGLSFQIQRYIQDANHSPISEKQEKILKTRLHKCGVLKQTTENMEGISPIAWQISTLSFLARATRDVEYLTNQMVLRFLRHADTYGKQFPFWIWQEYAKSCFIGLALEQPLKPSAYLKWKAYESILLSPGNLWSKNLPEWDVLIGV